MVRPSGMGFTMASWTAYMTMNGVLNASVSAGSSQRAARVTCRAQRISPGVAFPLCARAAMGWRRTNAHSVSARTTSEMEHHERSRSKELGMALTVVCPGEEGQPTQAARRRIAPPSSREANATAADARTLRVLEHHDAGRLRLARRAPVAVYVALNIEAFGFGVGKGAAIAPPDQAQSHSVYSWREYGNRVGVWRLFELLDELGVPAEAQMNMAIYEMAPDIPGRLRARGDEILGHGVTNSDEQGQLSEEGERALIQTVTATITRHEGAPPAAGWALALQRRRHHGPAQEAGYRYVMDWTMDDQPIWIRTRKGRLLAMPYPIEVNDTRGIVWYRYTAEEFADMIVDQFDEMLAQSVRQPLVSDLAPPVRHRAPVSHPPPAPGPAAHPPAPGSRLADASPRHLRPIAALPAGVVPGSRYAVRAGRGGPAGASARRIRSLTM